MDRITDGVRLQQTVSDLRKTVSNLKSLLKERDENLDKAAALSPGSPSEAYRNLFPDKWTKDEQGQ